MTITCLNTNILNMENSIIFSKSPVITKNMNHIFISFKIRYNDPMMIIILIDLL